MSVVRFDLVDTLGRITLTSPPYNYVSVQFNTDLAAAVHDASDSGIRALLVQAEGPNFSVGGAVDEWAGKSYRWFRTFIAEITSTYRAIEALEIPVVAAVRGQAVEVASSWRCRRTLSSPPITPSCGARRSPGPTAAGRRLPTPGQSDRAFCRAPHGHARRTDPGHHDPRGRRRHRARRSTR